MSRQRTSGIALVAAGVALNNYVYLHDLVFGKHEGMIYVGWKSVAGILVALAVVAAGLRALARGGGDAPGRA
jgi:hypothetical protein